MLIFILQDWNVIVNLGTMSLCDTFCDPDDISAFLLFQFQIRIKDAEMKLSQEGVDIEFDLCKIRVCH